MGRVGRAESSYKSINAKDAPNFPEDGWLWVGVVDLGADKQECRYCGKKHVCHMHTLVYPEYGELEVGYKCAGDILGSEIGEAPWEAETKLRSIARRGG